MRPESRLTRSVDPMGLEWTMYLSYFGMKQRPFGHTPQLGCPYPVAGQEDALAALRYAITQDRGIGLLIGPPGTGKTLVCHWLSTLIEPAFSTAMITNTNMSTVKALLQTILYDLSLPYHGLDEQELRLTLTDFLIGKYAGGGRTVLIIDEAQNLTVPLLEELRMLGNLEGQSDKLFQIVLAGHPRLLNLLRSSELESLNQRIGARCALTPLNDDQTAEYICHQLQSAGVVPDEVFTNDAIRAVYRATRGIPRRINQLCEHALLLASATEASQVTAGLVNRANTELNPAMESEAAEKTVQESTAPISDGNPCNRTQPSVLPRAVLEPVDVATSLRINCRDESFELFGQNSIPIQNSASTNLTALTPVTSSNACGDDEYFEQEEIIIDPYAMMDNKGPGSLIRPLNEPLSLAPTASLGTAPVAASTGLTPAKELADNSFLEDSPSQVPGGYEPVDPESPSIAFVDSSDNPAVHEVGAETIDQPGNAAAEPPILIIETRSQRLAGNIGRVDVPQQPAGGEVRSYRRLFTHARKS